MATEREGSSYTTAKWSCQAPKSVNRRRLCVSTSCSYGLNVECKNLNPNTILYVLLITQFEVSRFTCLNIKQPFISSWTYCPSNHGRRLRLSLAWHTRKQQTQSTYKGYIIPTPQLFLHCPSPIISLPGYNIRVPQQQVWVPFLNPTLFSIIKREKDLPWSTLPPVLQPGCLGHPCDPETERESKGESRYPTPHPQRCGAQRPGRASNPAQLLLLLSTPNWF